MIIEKRRSLEQFIEEQLIGPGGCSDRYLLDHNTEESLEGFSFGEVLNTTPGTIYSSAILFPQKANNNLKYSVFHDHHKLLDISVNFLDNSIKNEIFLGLFAKANEGDYNYNILSDQNKVASFKGSYKEHVEKIMKGKIKGVNSPIGKLLDVYNTVLPKVLKGDGSGDHKAWLLNPTVLRFITDVYNSGGLSGVQNIKPDQVIQYYLNHKPNYGSTDNMEISSSPVILNRGDIDNPVISGDIILEASGREIVLADDNGNFYADDLKVKQDIQKALSEAK